MQAQAAAGAGIITGFASNDILSGLGGNGRFVFTGRFGSGRITDFASGPGPGDVLKLSPGAAYHTVGEVMAAARQVGSDTVFNFGNLGSITLQNVALTSLTADDFLFAT